MGLVAAFLSGAEGKSAYLMAMLILGVILAAISFLIYRAGIFILGAGIGMSLGIYILHPTTSAMFFLCILIGVGLGCLAMRYAREVIIVGTSLLGGVMAGFYDPYADDYDPYDEDEVDPEDDFLEKTQVYQPKRKSAKPEKRQNTGRKL